MAVLKPINKLFLAELSKVCSNTVVDIGPVELEQYGQDIATNEIYNFTYLVKPTYEVEVAGIVKICSKYNVPITPRGGGSGVTGGASPVEAGLVLSTEKLNQIVAIDPINKIATVECGVITADFCKKVEAQGLYFPIQPSSSYMSFIGGNVAANSGSINSLKYGSTSDYVLNLQVVLANGEIIWTGANTSKNSTGPNITQLITGSEGTLAIITKVVLKLISKPRYIYSLSTEFDSMYKLCNAVQAIVQSQLKPSAIELVDGDSAKMTSQFLQLKCADRPIRNKPHLIVNFDGDEEERLDHELEACSQLIEIDSISEVLVGKTHAEKENIWEIRMNIGEALKEGGKGYRDIDIAVPVVKLFDYITEVKRISKAYSIQISCFGHAGNGNLHTMVSLSKSGDLKEDQTSKAIDEIYKMGTAMGGTISGEHGVGLLQKQFMSYQYREAYLNLLADIKKVFDPKNLINPGKII